MYLYTFINLDRQHTRSLCDMAFVQNNVFLVVYETLMFITCRVNVYHMCDSPLYAVSLPGLQ